MFIKKDHVKFLNYMNSQNTDVIFMVEEENENKIRFLEATVTREDDALTFFSKENRQWCIFKLQQPSTSCL